MRTVLSESLPLKFRRTSRSWGYEQSGWAEFSHLWCEKVQPAVAQLRKIGMDIWRDFT